MPLRRARGIRDSQSISRSGSAARPSQTILAVQVQQEATVLACCVQTVADETEVLFNEMRAAPSRASCGLAHPDAPIVVHVAATLHLTQCRLCRPCQSPPRQPNSDGCRVVYRTAPCRLTTSPPLPTAWGTVWGGWFERNVEQLAVADFLALWDVETGIVAACAALSDITHLETGHVARSVRVVRITGLADSKINHRVSYGAFIKPADLDAFAPGTPGPTWAAPPVLAVAPASHVVGVTDNPNLFPVQACTPNVL